MKFFRKKEKTEVNLELAKSVIFVERVKQLEPKFLEFLDSSLAFAEKQNNQADKELIAVYTQSMGNALQEIYAILASDNKLAMLGRVPVILDEMAKIESSSNAMEKRGDALIDFDMFKVATDKIGMTLQAALADLKA